MSARTTGASGTGLCCIAQTAESFATAHQSSAIDANMLAK